VEWSLLAGVPNDERRVVLADARRRRFRSNEVIFHEGDPADTVHLIAKGRVAIQVTTQLGDVAILSVLSAGDAFGELALLSPGSHRTASAVTLEPSETLAIHRDAFMTLRRTNPSIERWLIDHLAAEVVRLSAERLEAHYVSAPTRVFRRLVEMAELYGGCKEGTVIRLRQEDLATLAGTSRAQVNRTLRSAETNGWLTLGRGKIEILDPSSLRRHGG
jgi:CRP-like cAMP-binding protein